MVPSGTESISETDLVVRSFIGLTCRAVNLYRQKRLGLSGGLRPSESNSGGRLFNREFFRAAFGRRLVLLRGTVELQDPVDMDIGQAARDRGIVRVAAAVELVLAIAQFAFDLHVRAFLQLAGEFGELAPNGAAMPFGARVVAALRILPRGFGGNGEGGDRSVRGALEFCVVADEADEGNAVLIHDLNLLFLPCSLAGHPEAGGTCSPGQALHFLEEPEKMVFGKPDLFGRKPETRRAAWRKQRSAVPPGRRRR